MEDHGRSHLLRRNFQVAVCWLAAFGALSPGSQAQQVYVPPEMQADAELADVCFLDPDRGWAVGDRGTIWSTNDGGRNWRPQRSGIACRLNSVCFINGEDGWAVGGWTLPYSHHTRGVVLRTRDGGRNWSVMSGLTLPKLKSVKFFDADHAWAVGDGSSLYPAGVFRTEDGGRSWATVPSSHSQSWLTGDFLDPGVGIVAGRDGAVSLVRRTGLTPSPAADANWSHLEKMRFASRRDGWLIGDGGLVLRTVDGGASWSLPARLPSQTVATQFDFQALAVWGNHCWIAGAPGSQVFHSGDSGQTWQSFPTGQPLPIRGLSFIDDNRGWAVGALGLILTTSDGGRTWRRQNGGPRRAAILGVFADPDRVPLELFARLCGNEGYLGAVEILGRRDIETPNPFAASAPERTHESLLAVGASGAHTAWQFPLRQPGLSQTPAAIVEGWNRANGGHGVASMEEHLVRVIRQWQPDVIVTEPPSPHGDHPLAHFVNQIVLAAVDKAAESTAYPEQIAGVSLSPWRVRKVFSTQGDDRSPTLTLLTSQLAPLLGRSLADHAATARGLISRQYAEPPESVGFRLLVNHLPRELGSQDFFSGIVLNPGSEARRGSLTPTGYLDALRRMARKDREIGQLVSQSSSATPGSAVWLSQIDDLTRGLGDESAGDILFQIAQRYQSAEQYEFAAEVSLLLLHRYPNHDLNDATLLWLAQYLASGELNDGAADSRRKKSAELGDWIERSRPELFAEPALRFALLVSERGDGSSRPEEGYLRSLADRHRDDAWAARARAELWVAQQNGDPPPATCYCELAAEKPHLDGKLDDPVWQAARPLALSSLQHDDATWPAVVMLGRDEEFLYVAAACRKAPGAAYPRSAESRPRDADLSNRDRIDVLIDVDRDYGTFFRLTIDHRGWTSEERLGNSAWNPEWYVAADETGDTWTVEAAIPLKELTTETLDESTTWAVGVQRTVPRVGFQSWTQPAAIEVRPEGFSLLRFQ